MNQPMEVNPPGRRSEDVLLLNDLPAGAFCRSAIDGVCAGGGHPAVEVSTCLLHSPEGRYKKKNRPPGDAEAAPLATEVIGPRRRCMRTTCSLMALTAGMAAFTCALGALIGTSWVDTWEPIYLSNNDDWSALFGTGYGTLTTHGLASLKNSSPQRSEASQRKNMAAPVAETPSTTSTPWDDVIVKVIPPEVTRLPPSFHIRLANENLTNWEQPVRHVIKEDEDADYEEYDYLLDQPEPSAAYRVAESAAGGAAIDPANQFMIVVFRVGLWRACPSLLSGQLSPTIVLPNLPCVGLEYTTWRPLTAKSFRLWRDVEFTPDFLNKLRYATPCILLGSLISLAAVIVAISGRCAVPDRTLVCSSLHILAGLSLGSALVIFVSILHEEFYQPSVRFLRDPHVTSASNWDDPSVAVHSVASFRYGWTFYVALAAFINAELSAGLYIVLHSHAFKWHLRDKLPPPMAAAAAAAAAKSAHPNSATSKEIGVQTSPTKMAHSDTQQDECNHQKQISPCDLLSRDTTLCIREEADGEIPLLIPPPRGFNPMYGQLSDDSNGLGADSDFDCTCQVHYGTYRPPRTVPSFNHVAGIHRASTLPRKVAFGELSGGYQQTPL